MTKMNHMIHEIKQGQETINLKSTSILDSSPGAWPHHQQLHQLLLPIQKPLSCWGGKALTRFKGGLYANRGQLGIFTWCGKDLRKQCILALLFLVGVWISRTHTHHALCTEEISTSPLATLLRAPMRMFPEMGYTEFMTS